MTIKPLQNYARTSKDMKNLVQKILANAIAHLEAGACDMSPVAVNQFYLDTDEPVQLYAVRYGSKNGAQARQSRFYGIRKLFAADPSQLQIRDNIFVTSKTRGILTPEEINQILSCIFMRAEEELRGDGSYSSVLQVFFGKTPRPNASDAEELFEYRRMELVGTGAKTDIAPAGSGGRPIAITEPRLEQTPHVLSDDEIVATLAAVEKQMDNDIRSVFSSEE